MQSITLLMEHYGKSLNPENMSDDSMYALNELFLFYATSHVQFLNIVDSGLRSCSGIAGITNPSGLAAVFENLMFYKCLLERHTQHVSETMELIRGRHLLDWSRASGNKPQLIAARLQNDLEYLTAQSRDLVARCANQMTDLINHTSLEQSKRTAVEGKRIFRPRLLRGSSEQ